MRTPFATLIALLFATLLAGCSAVQAGPEAPPLEGSAWVLSAMPGRELVAGAPATLRFENGRAQGSDGCNLFTTAYTARPPMLEMSARSASTQMACPPALMRQSEAFMAALQATKHYRIASGQLELLEGDGTVLATFAAALQSLAGAAWRVTGINNGRRAVTSVLTGSTVTMAFNAEGRVNGSAGCNQYTAGYESNASRFRFVAPAATGKMCISEGVMEQEQNFLKALSSVASMRIEGNRLEFRSAEGALQITALREGGR